MTSCFLCSSTQGPFKQRLCVNCDKRYTQSIDPAFMRSAGQEFAEAAEVAEIAKYLIDQFHPDLQDPVITPIKYIYLKNTPKSRDKLQFGRASKVSGLSAWLHSNNTPTGYTVPQAFFLMEISWETWIQLQPHQKVALVDHELEHFSLKDGDLYIKGHDVEEFSSVVRRQGLWREEVKEFLDAAREAEANPLFAGLETSGRFLADPIDEDSL